MLQELLNEHLLDTKNTHKMFELAREYDRLKQGAAAISFYTRAADLEEDDKFLQYQCMLYAGKCFERQGNRGYTTLGFYQHAVGLLLDRPEAYFILANEFAKKEDWHTCLIYAKLGLKYWYVLDILEDVDYPGDYALKYLVALCEWKIKTDQKSRLAFFNLKYNANLNDEYKTKVEIMLAEAKYPDTIPYSRENVASYKFPFDGIYSIETNYAKHFQDMFVLSCYNGKQKGSYLEIGSGHPFIHNNTALLETEFNWKGLSIDENEELSYKFAELRNNTILRMNALDINYSELLQKHCFNNVIDYLHIDTNNSSYEVLSKIPLNEYKFGVITFEHNGNINSEIREVSRHMLKSNGYILVGKNISYNLTDKCEDWYVHPDVVKFDPKMETDDKLNFVWSYMMNDINR